MDQASLKTRVIALLRTIAPEMEESELVPDRPLRSQVDLDSMDWLNFLIGLHKELGVDIPEADYARLTTLDKLLEYLDAKLRAK